MSDVEEGAVQMLPSWMRWPPNCCESCTGWKKESDWDGRCARSASKHHEDKTDARQRCAEFKRRSDI